METALNGVRVLDHTRVLSGPFCTMILADLGAGVIKIEAPEAKVVPQGNADTYHKGQPINRYNFNRNKKSMVLDLRTDKGREIFYELVKKSDVSVDNFRPPVLERLKIDYDTLREINPRIICASVSGYGAAPGPYRDRPFYDTIGQAMSGIMSIIGEPGIETPPLMAGLNMCDITAGMWTTQGILAALYQRDRTGEGQMVDISLADGMFSIVGGQVCSWLNKGTRPKLAGSGHMGPTYAFPTKDGWLQVAGGRFEGNCKTVGRPDLMTDPRFADRNEREKNRGEFWKILADVYRTKTWEEWEPILVGNGVPCSRINTIPEAAEEPQFKHRNMVIEVDDGFGDKVKIVGNPIKLSATPEEESKRFFASSPPGRHTDEVLSELLGYSGEQIDKLVEEKVVERMAEIE